MPCALFSTGGPSPAVALTMNSSISAVLVGYPQSIMYSSPLPFKASPFFGFVVPHAPLWHARHFLKKFFVIFFSSTDPLEHIIRLTRLRRICSAVLGPTSMLLGVKNLVLTHQANLNKIPFYC